MGVAHIEEVRLSVFENRAKRNEITREWSRLCNEEVYALCSLPDITRVMKLRNVRWAEHVAHIAERRGA
jgi:hypothetical protein